MNGPDHQPQSRADPLRPVLLVWLFLTLVTSLPYARAWLYPPRGTEFLGNFYSMPDVYNYLSYVQQAEDGAFVFVNKLTIEPHPPALVNLEWWTIGRLSALIGRHPTLAYRLFGLAATLALLLAADRWLALAGIPGSHRLAALLLVSTGAGFGGALFLWSGPPAWRFLDLTTGLYPIISVLVNPHFVIGTALLTWALLAFHLRPDARGQAASVLLGSVLGLIRPYDLVMLVVIRSIAVLALEPRRRWVPLFAWLLGFAPVAAYNYWVFYRNPAFKSLSGFTYSFPPVTWIALALAPAALLAVPWVWTRARRGEPGYAGQIYFAAWIAAGVLFLLQPVSYSLQMLVNFGLPILALVAVVLSRFGPGVTMGVAGLLLSTGLIGVKLLLEDNPTWFVPAVKLQAARAFRSVCRPGDLALSPPDIGQYVNAYSPCKAYVSHWIAPGYEARERETLDFYDTDLPARRGALLDRHCIRHVLLPASAGPDAEPWLGRPVHYRQAARTGDEPWALGIYTRAEADVCPQGVGEARAP